MKSLHLNTSYKHHSIVALVISVWLVLFLVVIAPFDASDLSFKIRLQILPFYGVITFVSYLLVIPVQNFIFRTIRTWNIALEIVLILIYTLIALIGCYAYYTSKVINGTYPLVDFILGIYYPIFFVMLIVIVFSRWLLNKRAADHGNNSILLRGDNRLDVLQIDFTDLVSISSADNYVEVNYIQEGALTKKLLRSTLKSIRSEVPGLLQVHRSHLINPMHFKNWKDANTVQLTQIDAPVSKKYRKEVLAIKHLSQKAKDSPQRR